MKECLALLLVICMLQPVVGPVEVPNGNGRTLMLPRRTPGMTDREYSNLLAETIGVRGASFSFTGSDGKQVTGKIDEPFASSRYASSRGSLSSPFSPPTGNSGFLRPRFWNFSPPSGYSGGNLSPYSPPRAYNVAPASTDWQAYENTRYFGNDRGRYGGPSIPGSITNLRTTGSSPPVQTQDRNYGYGRGTRAGSNNNWLPKTSLPELSSRLDTSTPMGYYPLFPPAAPKITESNFGERENNYNSQLSESGAQAAGKLAVAIIDGVRNELNRQNNKLSGGEKVMMDLCEKSVASQQQVMMEMKKSDKTLMDVLPIFREKLIVEILNFYQKEIINTNMTKDSKQMNTLLILYAECVRPKLVLMKVS